MMTERLPSYDELPVVEGAPPGSSWGLWGDDDVLGCLNLLTPSRIASAIATVREHTVISLDLPLDLPSPPLFLRRPYEHVVTDLAVGHDEFISNWYPQAGSQWDGFRHVRHPGFGFYNGVPDAEHGIDSWARRGIMGRGLLLDVGRWREAVGRPIDFASPDQISVDDLSSTAAAQGATIETGDILVIRTGWLEWYRASSQAVREELAAAGPAAMRAPGLAVGEEMSAYLWNHHVAAVAADNPALESWPRGYPRQAAEVAGLLADPDRCTEVFLHFSLLALLGIPLGELWDLDVLADACASDGRYEFLLVSSPLNLPGGVGSPANALAIR